MPKKTKELHRAHWLVRWLERYAKGTGLKVTALCTTLFVIITILLTVLEIELVGIQEIVYSTCFMFFIISIWLTLVGSMWKD